MRSEGDVVALAVFLEVSFWAVVHGLRFFDRIYRIKVDKNLS